MLLVGCVKPGVEAVDIVLHPLSYGPVADPASVRSLELVSNLTIRLQPVFLSQIASLLLMVRELTYCIKLLFCLVAAQFSREWLLLFAVQRRPSKLLSLDLTSREGP
jgi:hypothetical protein